MVGEAAGEGTADVRGDELPFGRGDEDGAEADGDALFRAGDDAVGEPLGEGEAKEISPDDVS
ncbi:hypothetical protein GCM10010251_79440 [Streptomyces aurantiogriseus]|uniref:DUF5709 domain-containing protein n=1 Tax=Streptomyces aurantiogriseus TaxID=66870 RepID=A0A918KYQ3_9ACTN|nr:hypothetical protein GCM10010251_79440 [Streptomyces aurantiogriseus]